MTLNKLVIFTFLSAFFLAFTGCSDLYKAKKPKKSFLKLCQLNTKNFSKIFTKNISKDINCAHESLRTYMKLTRSDKPGKLSKAHLLNMLEKNFSTTETMATSKLMIEFVFDLSYLIWGKDKNFIDLKKLNKLRDFIIYLNQVIVEQNLYHVVQFSENEEISIEEFYKRRAIVDVTSQKLKNKFFELFFSSKEVHDPYDYRSLLFQIYESNNKIESFEKIDKMLFLKPFLLGGVAGELTQSQLFKMFKGLDDFAVSFYSFYALNKIKIKDDQNFWDKSFIVSQIIEKLEKHIVEPLDQSQIVLTKSNLNQLVEIFAEDYKSYLKYDKAYITIKKIIFENNSPHFSFQDLKLLTDLIKEVLQVRQEYDSFYQTYSSYFIKNKIVKILPSLNDQISYDEKKQTLTLPNILKKNELQFLRIMQNYRYFKGTAELPMFSFETKYNSLGVFEIYLFEKIAAKIMKAYGKEDPSAVGGFNMSQNDLERIIFDTNDILLDQKILIEGRERNTAESAMIILGLFCPQSNGDLIIDIPEFTEFANAIISSISVGDFFLDEMIILCQQDKNCTIDEKNRIPADFFRKNFYQVFMKDRSPKNQLAYYFPRLSQYFNNLFDLKHNKFSSDYEKFHIETANFSRVCRLFPDGTEIPMGSGDMLSVFGGMITVEQSFNRFDINGNNILDYPELVSAYELVYKDALERLLPKNLRNKSKQIFMYLVNYRKLPDGDSLRGKLHAGLSLYLKTPKPSADRLTIAIVLKTLGEESTLEKNTTPEELAELCNRFR